MAQNTLLQELKAFDPDRYDVDEMVALKTFGALLAGSYTQLALEVPEWLSDATTRLEKEIKGRRRDMLEKELRETEARLDSLKTAEEKRQDLRARAQRLKDALA